MGTSTHTVDIVRDVIKRVPVYWAADLVGGLSIVCAVRMMLIEELSIGWDPS